MSRETVVFRRIFQEDFQKIEKRKEWEAIVSGG